ncbi:hypothetical protein TNCV_1066401 [Trichonephila clavipes]|uniref:Transposase Tc1-like domain-containing protein n=1 Tax=Trichonephila clavipes TaxID=2585209 RepID=A0A8X6R9Z1_TRICX|nr:hypothetical protein TNCV_1066401 [Trichonephila clavipes]
MSNADSDAPKKPANVSFISNYYLMQHNAGSSPIRPYSVCCEEVLGPVDPRDVIYTKTSLRTPSTEQSLRRPPHPKKNTRTALSTTIQPQIAPLLGAPVSSRTIQRRLDEGHLGARHALRVLPLTPNHRHLHMEWSCP